MSRKRRRPALPGCSIGFRLAAPHDDLLMAGTLAAVVAQGDRRFKHADWEEHALFDYIKQSYLIAARWLHKTVAEVEGLDPNTAKKVDFFTRQYIDAMAPSNFALTNPEVLQETVKSGGENLVKGLHNLLDDIERGNGQLKISMTDPKAFREGVGRLLAEVQRIKAQGDYPAAKRLFETYGVHFDPKLRDEVVARVQKLNLPSYTGFVMPKLEPAKNPAGEITDVAISYPMDLTSQMLEYSAATRNLR